MALFESKDNRAHRAFTKRYQESFTELLQHQVGKSSLAELKAQDILSIHDWALGNARRKVESKYGWFGLEEFLGDKCFEDACRKYGFDFVAAQQAQQHRTDALRDADFRRQALIDMHKEARKSTDQ